MGVWTDEDRATFRAAVRARPSAAADPRRVFYETIGQITALCGAVFAFRVLDQVWMIPDQADRCRALLALGEGPRG